MEQLLDNSNGTARTKHDPEILIAELLDARPEGILLLAIGLEIGGLVGAGDRVAAFLVVFGGLVAAEEAQVGVVGDGAEQLDGREHVAGVEQDGEGEVNQGVAEVAWRMLVRRI